MPWHFCQFSHFFAGGRVAMPVLIRAPWRHPGLHMSGYALTNHQVNTPQRSWNFRLTWIVPDHVSKSSFFLGLLHHIYSKITPPIYHSMKSSHVKWPMSQVATCDRRGVTGSHLWHGSLNMWRFYTVIYWRGYFTVDLNEQIWFRLILCQIILTDHLHPCVVELNLKQMYFPSFASTYKHCGEEGWPKLPWKL